MVDHCIEDLAGSRRERSFLDFFGSPGKDSRAETSRLHQSLHKADLIDTDLKKKPCEGSERLFAQSTPAIEIMSALQITFGEQLLVAHNVTCKSASHRP